MRNCWSGFITVLALALPTAGRADLQPIATYQFQNTLAADQSAVASLAAVDPLGMNGYVADTPYGHARQVYQFLGNTDAAYHSGLTLVTTSLISANDYSAELVFLFSQRDNLYRRIIDVQNRASDNGFYVDPGNHLSVYPVVSGSTQFTNNAYHHVVLTVSSAGTTTAYLDGTQEFNTPTAVMNINNPDNLMNFFLDNYYGNGQGEYSSGRIALARIYNDVLTADQVRRLANDPFPPATVPEPASLALLGLGGLALAAWRRLCRPV